MVPRASNHMDRNEKNNITTVVIVIRWSVGKVNKTMPGTAYRTSHLRAEYLSKIRYRESAVCRQYITLKSLVTPSNPGQVQSWLPTFSFNQRLLRCTPYLP